MPLARQSYKKVLYNGISEAVIDNNDNDLNNELDKCYHNIKKWIYRISPALYRKSHNEGRYLFH